MARFLLITTRTAQFNPDHLPAHYAHIDALRAKGCLELAGGWSDATGGAYLIQVQTRAEAEAIAAADPLIASGSSTIVVKEWNAK